MWILSLNLKEKDVPVWMIHPGFMKRVLTEELKELYDELGALNRRWLQREWLIRMGS